ncbi:TolC family protein [soil metagenome]
MIRRRAVGLVVLLLTVLAQPVETNAQAARLTLDRAIELAVENSRDLRDAELELEGAERRVSEAWGSVFPKLDLSASYTRNLAVPGTFLPGIFFDPDADPDDLVAVKFGSDNVWGMQLRAEQPLFRAVAFVGVGAASRYEALQNEVVRGRTHAVVTRVRIAYYDVLLAEEAVRLTENTVSRITQTLDEMRKMERAGVASNYDVLRLEVELANVEPALRRARNAASAARRALAVELGVDELSDVAVVGDLASIAVDSLPGLPVTDTVQWPDAVQLAVQLRSDVRQLHLMEQLRNAELRAEQSEYLPTLSLFGTYSINAQQSGSPVFFGESDAQRAYGRQIGVQLTLPLFAGMQRPARVGQRRAVIAQVRTQQELVRDQVENQVRTALEQVFEARQRVDAQSFGVQQARRGYAIASAQFREGISSALELTDAEVALRQSEFNYAEAIYDYLVARARLDQAMGNIEAEVER